MDFSVTSVLENPLVRLEPLALHHHDDLCAAVSVGDLWTTWYASVPSPDQMKQEIERRLTLQKNGEMAPWAIVARSTGRPVGMTTFMNLDPTHRRLEIGSTWLGKEAQRTGVNPAAKLLLLSRAFDDLGCIAVELRTHWHNHASRAAIARLGAKQDGVLRNHMVWKDGTVRDTVVFSILDCEWATVRRGLESRLS
ncbi:GNAT family N-acetyltransferase [Demequina sp. TTPB684]|uniref:GNAT family N-acetyltransferase n=1 Tax=unclassified Demequina TaxID=2620311 RepID=UPI001CF43445|nr:MULTISPECIES: GNAT family protein [unclassified Demequina]MCB2414031.1 GNAT family N-acetyltransferase [Demequina sp. TTPB684]UPU89089.1 GNAT family N-acetyltransferase [Demequina sp. TMPB413]